jgi:phage terminase large subunit
MIQNNDNTKELLNGDGVGRLARAEDPVWFTRAVTGGNLWQAQRDILDAIARHSRVAVKACHASGKSYAIALAVVWWLVAHPDGIVVTTAPTWLQVDKVIWGEIKKILLQVQARGIVKLPRPQQTELRIGPGNYAIGLSTDDSSRLQGFHSGHVLIVLDEAPGVRPDIYEAIEGIRAGGEVHVLAIGNPTVASGPFYAAFTTERGSWKTFTISAFDTPNLEGLPIEELRKLPPGLPENDPVFAFRPRPYLVTRRWVYEKFWEWGEESPLFQSRVLGNFQELAQNSLIPLRYLEQAREPKSSTDDDTELYAGIDVADAGDNETVCVVLTRTGRIVDMQCWHGNSRGRVIEFLSRFNEGLLRINYDEAGVGAYFADDFDQFGLAETNGINVGKASMLPKRFRNLKAQLYWNLREAFERGLISGLKDETWISQLASIRYEINSRGQIEIESKQARMQRGVKSPDRAEALMLAFANLTPGIIQFYRDLAGKRGSLGEPEPDQDDGQDLIREYQKGLEYWAKWSAGK